jgi:hypothetical protein
MGCPTVIIGQKGMGGSQGAAMRAAAKNGAAVCHS